MDNAKDIEELFHQYKKDVHNFLLYYMKTSDIDDVFQETFVNALKALNHHAVVSSTRSWLISIARNAAIDYLRKENSHKKKVDNIKIKNVRQNPLSVDEQVQLDERKTAILNAIYQLKKSYQEVVILRGLKEFSVSETARILNWNENKVKLTYHRALKKLRQILDQGGDRIGSL